MSNVKAAVVLIAGCLAAARAPGGIGYTAVTKAEGQQGAGEAGGTTVQALVDGPSAKVMFNQSGNPAAPAGTYMLTKDAGQTMYLVNPAEKTYMKWDLDQLAAVAGGAMQMARGIINLQFTDTKVEKLADEPGPKILGYPTRHYKFVSSYKMTTSFLGRKSSASVVTEEDMWTTTQFDDAGLTVWRRAGSMKTGDEQLDGMIAAQIGKAQGFPLKHVSASTSTDEKGRSNVTRTTMEVKELKATDVPKAAFEIPAGYKEETLEAPREEGDQAEEPSEAPKSLKSLMKMFSPKSK